MAHLAFLQDFAPQPSALEHMLFQVCMASLRPPRPICHVHHAGLVGSSCGLSLSNELQSVPCHSPLLCPVPVFEFPFPSKCLWSSMSAGTSQSRRDSRERRGGRDMTLSSLLFCAAGRWSQTEDSVVPEAVAQVVLP